MVEVSRVGRNIYLEVKGLHKLWAFKSSLTIPSGHIMQVYQDEAEVSSMFGLRALGTSFPGLISSGTFLTEEGNVFCDVTNKKNAIVIRLRNEYYTKLIVEVEDPLETIYFLARH